MKGYAIALALIVIIGFSAIGFIIYQAFPHDSRKISFVLHTNKMVEWEANAEDSVSGPAVIAAYFIDKNSISKDTIHKADAFVCVARDKSDSTKTDTVLLLDTRLIYQNGDMAHPENYWTGVKSTKRLNECRIIAPGNMVKRIYRYKYKYATVEPMTED